jgi:hypothetical protein
VKYQNINMDQRPTQSVDRPPESSLPRNTTARKTSNSNVKNRMNKTTVTKNEKGIKPRTLKSDTPSIGSHPSVRKDSLKVKKGTSGSKLQGSKMSDQSSNHDEIQMKNMEQEIISDTAQETPTIASNTDTVDITINESTPHSESAVPLGTKLDLVEFYKPIPSGPKTIDEKVESLKFILFPTVKNGTTAAAAPSPPSTPGSPLGDMDKISKDSSSKSLWTTPVTFGEVTKPLPQAAVFEMGTEEEVDAAVLTSTSQTVSRNHAAPLERRGSFSQLAAALMDKENVSLYMNHKGTEAFLGLALITTLFLPDLWTIGNPANDMDNLLNGILLLFFIAFTIEMVAL